MGTRLMTSVPFQIFSWIMFFQAKSLAADPGLWNMFYLVLVNAVFRVLFWKFGGRILALKNGITYYRLIFGASFLFSGFSWSYVALRSFEITGGVTPASMVVFTTVMATSASVTAVFSFDVIWNILIMAVITLPTAYGFLNSPSEGSGLFGLGAVLTGVFFSSMALSVKKLHWQLLRSNEELEEKGIEIRRAHGELKETHGLIQAMLESIDEAFLIFNSAGAFINAPSKKSSQLLGLDLSEAKNLPQILRVQQPAAAEQTLKWLDFAFKEKIPFESMVSSARSVIELDDNRILKVKYHPLRDEEQKIKSLVMTATDITREKAAEKKAEVSRERAELILRIQENKSGFRAFLSDCERVCHSAASWDGNDLDTLKRELHTMKGTAAMFGADSLSKAVHASEIAIRESSPTDLLKTVRARCEDLRRFFMLWKHREMETFTVLGVFGESVLEVSSRKLDEMELEFARDPEAKKFFEGIKSRLLTNDLKEVLSDFELHVQSVAVKLGKKVGFAIVANEQKVLIPVNFHREAFRFFVHLFNNALDHGIEKPDERVRAGKSDTGHITIRYERFSDDAKSWLRILIEDDGRGIDVGRVREKLIKSGRKLSGTESDLDIAMHVFDDGLSTRDTVSEVSGQGVGMGAVRAAILKARGKIRISKTDPQGTTFEIILPDAPEAQQQLVKKVTEAPPRRSAA